MLEYRAPTGVRMIVSRQHNIAITIDVPTVALNNDGALLLQRAMKSDPLGMSIAIDAVSIHQSLTFEDSAGVKY